MANLLGLDLGTAKTGVAFADDAHGFVMALPSIRSTNDHELIQKIEEIVREKKIEQIIIGLPLLLSGEEGSQVTIVRALAKKISDATKLSVAFVDERFSSGKKKKSVDDDARAACEILSIFLERKSASS